MPHKFRPGQVVRVLNGDHDAAVKPYVGQMGIIGHAAESAPDLVFCSIHFRGSWHARYVGEEHLELVKECDPNSHGSKEVS